MFNLFNKKDKILEHDLSLIAVASLLIHSAKIDENFTDKERKIIKNSLIEMGAEIDEIDEIMQESEKKEKDSNQILDFTREVKNIEEDKKKLIIVSSFYLLVSKMLKVAAAVKEMRATSSKFKDLFGIA